MKEKKATMTKLPALVVIPYLAAGAKGGELQAAVFGWLHNFKADFKVVIVGDYHPICDQLKDQVTLIKCDRVSTNPPLEVAAKMFMIMKKYPDYPGMIWTNDDIYPVNPFKLSDVKALKIIGQLNGNADSKNIFSRNMHKTKAALKAAGLPTRNYSTHLPVYYDFKKLRILEEEYHILSESYLIQSLYHNRFYVNPDANYINVHTPGNRYKLGIYDTTKPVATDKDFAGVIWVNHSNECYSDQLIANIIKWNHGQR